MENAITAIYRKELTESISDAIKAILLATIAGLVLGFGLYKSDIFVFVEDRELQNLFENNKTIIGESYYSKYENNKDNIIKLRIERNL